VLSSLQKPRKISILGSDGNLYNLLCKKDDLRKDQRLMEFNGMINRFLKRDVESNKRRLGALFPRHLVPWSGCLLTSFLGIKTYAVTPLNEECGLIEWVDNLRTLRDLVIKLLKDRGITVNVSTTEFLNRYVNARKLMLPLFQYNEIRQHLNEACSDDSKLGHFSKILAK
jgi:serine/threonine-protein kinase ATR